MKIIDVSAVTDLTADAAEAGFRKVPLGGEIPTCDMAADPANPAEICRRPSQSELAFCGNSVRDFSTISEILAPVGALRPRVARHCPGSGLGMELAVAGKFQISPIFA